MPPRPGAAAPIASSAVLAVLALVFNAFVWGTSWLPFRHLQQAGLHPLRATALTFAFAALLIALLRPRSVAQVVHAPSLWVLILASGTTNAAFNWAVVIGDVVRVVLLFYLMPLWTILLARLLLGERITAMGALRVLLGFAGAAIVLWPVDRSGLAALPLPRDLSEGLGLLGGFSFALNNVMLRREASRPEEGRALAMFVGGAVVAGTVSAVALPASPWPAPSATSAALLLLVTALFLSGNLALQYGAARLPANRTAVVMLTEVLFATASSVLLGSATLTFAALAGGALIVAAAALAAIEARPVDTLSAPGAPPR